MKTNLTRRQVSLALPSSLLLTACGGGGDDMIAASDPITQPEAVADFSELKLTERVQAAGSYTIERLEELLQAFLTFYNDKYRPWAALCMATSLHGLQTGPFGTHRYSLYQIINGHYDCQDTILEAAANYFTGGDKQEQLDWITLTQMGFHLKGLFAGKLTNPAGVQVSCPYTADEYTRWGNWLLNMTTENIIDIKEGRNYAMARIGAFMRAHPGYSTFIDNVKEAGTVHSRRLGWFSAAKTSDTVKPTYSYTKFRYFGFLELGNDRKIIPRVKLDNQRGFLGTMFLGEKNTTLSTTLNARNVTQTVGTVDSETTVFQKTTSSQFAIGGDQITAIDHYVNEDIKENGPFAGMTEADSKQMLRKLTAKAAYETGHTYESYVMVTYCCRAMAQAAVFSIRAAASLKAYGGADNPGFDIAQMVSVTKDAVMNDPQINNLVNTNRVHMAVGLAMILGYTVVGAGYSWALAIYVDKEIKKDPSASQATITPRVVTSFKQIWTAGVNVGAVLGAVGITGWLTLSPQSYDLSRAKWIPTSFGLVDAVSAVGDLYNVIKFKKLDATGIALATSASFRALSGLFAVIDYTAKCRDWTVVNRITGSVIWKPIYFATITSGVTLMSLIIQAAST